MIAIFFVHTQAHQKKDEGCREAGVEGGKWREKEGRVCTGNE